MKIKEVLNIIESDSYSIRDALRFSYTVRFSFFTLKWKKEQEDGAKKSQRVKPFSRVKS
jgi:hypothetical protein